MTAGVRAASETCKDLAQCVDRVMVCRSVGLIELRLEVPMRFASRRSFLVLGVAGIGATLVAARDGADTSNLTAAPTAAATYGMRVAPIQLQSAGVMHFAADGILFLADSRAGAVYAIAVAEQHRDTSA